MRESYRPNEGERGAEAIRTGVVPLFGPSGRSAALRFGIGLPLTVAVALLVWWLADRSQMLSALRVLYHLRIGTSWFNFTRFWRLVLENPDPTGGNFLEQIPQLSILVLAFQMLVSSPSVWTFAAVGLTRTRFVIARSAATWRSRSGGSVRCPDEIAALRSQ